MVTDDIGIVMTDLYPRTADTLIYRISKGQGCSSIHGPDVPYSATREFYLNSPRQAFVSIDSMPLLWADLVVIWWVVLVEWDIYNSG